MRSKSFKKLFSFLLLIGVLSGNFSAFGQKNNSAKKNTKNSASKCSGAWTGVVTYTRTQTMSDNKTIKRVSGRGEDTRDWEMKYDYTAKVAVVESPERNGSNVGKATINHDFS